MSRRDGHLAPLVLKMANHSSSTSIGAATEEILLQFYTDQGNGEILHFGARTKSKQAAIGSASRFDLAPFPHKDNGFA